jgi:hypothetical protein
LTQSDPNQAPTSVVIHNLVSEIYTNTRQIETELGIGRGHLGHLALAMPEAEYLALAGPSNAYLIPLVRPDFPDYSNAAVAGERDAMKRERTPLK